MLPKANQPVIIWMFERTPGEGYVHIQRPSAIPPTTEITPQEEAELDCLIRLKAHASTTEK